MEGFFAEQKKLMARAGERQRYLYNLIDWRQPCIGILGARGTGKTTLMLQYLREKYAESDRALYISVDSPFFHARSLAEFGQEFQQMGGELLLIDEIHKYPDWSVHVKTMLDSLPDLRIVFSGSSLLQIKKQKGDLSRRAVIYNLHGLSFREYINFVADRDMNPLSFEDVLKSHTIHAPAISCDLKILRLFRDYMVCGYYPFFLEGAAYYGFKLREVINHILETDIPFINRIEQRQITKIKRLIYLLATAFPLMTNMQKLSEATEISRPKLYEYLEHLHEARLINLVRGKGRGYEIMTKPDKIYLENANLAYAIAENVNQGTLRELFFVNQVNNCFSHHPVFIDDAIELSPRGDFFVKKEYTFEIGGKGKTYDQIAGQEKSFIVADDLESGFGNKIPLWLFGFLY